MRRMRVPFALVAAMVLLTGAAKAAPDDPWVAYVANSAVSKGGRPAPVILRFDPASGALTQVSGNGAQGALFEHPYDIAVAPGAGSLYVADMGSFAADSPVPDGRIVRVDPATGVQSLVTQGGNLEDPAGVAVAPDGTLFVVENVGTGRGPSVVRVDPATGAQSVVTEGGNLCYPFGIAIDAHGSLLVTDFGDFINPATQEVEINCLVDAGMVLRVDPGSGAQAIASSNQAGNSLLRGTFGVAVEPAGGILVVNQTSATAAVAAIDPGSGQQTVVTPNASLDDAFEFPQRVAVAPDGNLIVVDYALNDREGGLVRVDRSSGAGLILRQGMLFNNPLGVTLVVNRPPSAALSLSARKVAAGTPVRFDASASADPERLPLRYDWDLDGNGVFEIQGSGASVVERSFGSSTTFTPRVRVSDPHGGQALAQAPEVLMVDAIAPVVSRFRSSARRLAVPARPAGPPARARSSAVRAPRAVRFRFRSSEPARVTITLRRALAGRSSSGRCVPPRRALRRARSCTRWLGVVTLRLRARAGANSLRFSARDRARPVKPGRYRAVATAIDDVGNRSLPRSLPLLAVDARP